MASEEKKNYLWDCTCDSNGTWNDHDDYCPIWKDGRITELEDAMNNAIDFLQLKVWHLRMEWYTASANQIEKEVVDKFKELLKEK